MEDKEVGKLLWWVLGSPGGKVPIQEVLALIRKLVDERADNHNSGHHYPVNNEYVELALRDFGIDPESYK